MKKILFLTCSLLFVLLNACAPVYVPATHASPMLEKQGEVHTSLYTGTNGFNGQFAYAPTDKFGVMFNGMYLTDKEEGDNDREYENKIVYGEIAFGRYSRLNNFFRLESYLGVGHGWSRAWDGFNLFTEDDEDYVKGYFNKYFATTNLAFATTMLDAGFGARLAYVDFYSLVDERDNKLGSSRNAFFAEPMVFTRLGHGLIKYEMMVGLTLPVNKKPRFDYDPMYISIGVHLNWGAVKEE